MEHIPYTIRRYTDRIKEYERDPFLNDGPDGKKYDVVLKNGWVNREGGVLLRTRTLGDMAWELSQCRKVDVKE
jgi:hypothetical protein